MSAPTLSARVAHLAADPVLAGHPIVAVVGKLVARLGVLEQELVLRDARIASQDEELADLRRQLGRHSGNSGQPPSQDGPQAPPRTRSRRRSQGRRPGGQPGHAGTTRRQVAAKQAHRHVDHWPVQCRGCGAALPRTAAGAPARRQVHDLPAPPPLEVTEHRAQAVCCPGCGARTRAAFPAEVAGPVQFGPRLEALAVYLPVARTQALLRELHGVSLSTATVEALCRRAAARLAPEAARQRAQARAVPVACMDETGLRVAGETDWLHTIGDETVTAYRLGGRGEVWEGYAGTAVHDRFAAYWSAMADETVHTLCNAHLLRNLEEIVELEKEPDGWAARMQRLLLEARDTAAHWHGTTGGPVPEDVRAETAAAWDALLKPVLEHYESLPPPTRGRGRRRGHNLALALRKEREACLRFMDPAVPFTHNRAERALRMAKVHLKIAGCFRTRDGAERFALLRGLVETARQRRWPLLDFLRLGPDAAVMPQPP